MPRRVKKRAGKNISAKSRVFSFKLNRDYADHARARDHLERWLDEEARKPKAEANELSDLITELILRYSGELQQYPIRQKSSPEIADIRDMVGEILMAVRTKDSRGLAEFAMHSPVSDEDPFDQEFIQNMIEGYN